MTEPAHGGPTTSSNKGRTKRVREPKLGGPGRTGRLPLSAKSNGDAVLDCEALSTVPRDNPNPIVRIGRDGILLFANPAAQRCFRGLKLELDKPAPRSLVAIAKKVIADRTSSHEVRSGARVFLVNGNESVKDQFVHLYGVDITERKKIEEALVLSEARHRLLTEQAVDGVLVADFGTLGFCEANPAAQKLFGCNRGELLGLKASDFIEPDALPRLIREMRQLKQGRTLLTECGVIRRDGCRVSVEFNIRLLPDGRLHALLRDVSERKQMEERNRETEARLRTALNSLIEGCQILGFDWTYEFVNPAAARHARLPLEELIGRKMTDVFPRVESTPLFTSLRRSMQDRTACELENEFSYPDGSTAVFQLVVQPVPEGIFILSHDITDRRRLEEQILNVRDREQQRIGSDLHDEVGQQLTAISLLNSLLQHELNARHMPSAAQAGKIAGLITQVMTTIRRISHGLQPVSDEPGGLMTALKELAVNSAAVSTRFECPKPVLLRNADCSNHLFRIAQEAVQNALRHAHPSTIVIRLLRDQRNLVLEVQDDGIGFDGDQSRKGMGLQTMKYRARAIRGILKFLQPDAGGTLVRCSTHLAAQRDPDQSIFHPTLPPS